MITKTDKTIPEVEYMPGAESSAGIEIRSLASFYAKATDLAISPFAPHRVQFHHLMYIEEGHCDHFVDFERHRCEPGTFVLVNKNQVHAFDGTNRVDGLMILFTQGFLDSIHTSMRLPVNTFGFRVLTSLPVIHVTGDARDSCTSLLAEITRISGHQLDDSLIIQLLFASLFLKLRQSDQHAAGLLRNEEGRQHLLQFMHLIETNFHQTKDALAYADMLGLTYKTLNEICKKSVQRTPKQLIDAHTILEAKRRMAIDQTQMSQVAYDLGFNEVTNFVKYFKKHTNETPSQFQRRLTG